MYRRTGLLLFLLFGLWAVWMTAKPVAYESGRRIDFSEGTVESVVVSCGEAIPILWGGEFDDSVPSTAFYMRSECEKAARSHFAWIVMFGAASITFLIIGLVRGPAPKVPRIDLVLKRLPTPAELHNGATTAVD